MERAEFAAVRVLMVGPKGHNLQLLRSVLSIAGVGKIMHVEDPLGALDVLRNESFAAVYCDGQTPAIDGSPFAMAARRAPALLDPMIAIFVLKDCARRRDVENARDIGATDFLTTPLAPATVITKLRAAIHAPRPFIMAPDFFGPDRRGKTRTGFSGSERRVRAARKTKVDFSQA